MSLFSNVRPSKLSSSSASLSGNDRQRQEVNLSTIEIHDNSGNSAEYSSYSQAKSLLLSTKPNKEYPPLLGALDFLSSVTSLLWPKSCNAIAEKRLIVSQSVTAALSNRVATDLIGSVFRGRPIFIPNISNANLTHIYIRRSTSSYPYLLNGNLNFEGILEYFSQITDSPVYLPLGGADPSGVTLSPAQWDSIIQLARKNNLFLLLDASYVGFSSGDFNHDLYPIYQCEQNNIEFFLNLSLAANFSLSADATGVFVACLNQVRDALAIESQIIALNRAYVSFPSQFPARIISSVLSNDKLRSQWREDLKVASKLISNRKALLLEHLVKEGAPIDKTYWLTQSGPFVYLSLSSEQWGSLSEKHGVHTGRGGRLNLTAITSSNVNYVAWAVARVLLNLHNVKF